MRLVMSHIVSCCALHDCTVPLPCTHTAITVTTSIVGIIVGVSISVVVILGIIGTVCCCLCCVLGKSSSSRRLNQVIVQPQNNTTAYPMQVATQQTAYVPQGAPPQQYTTSLPATAPYPASQPAPQNVYAPQQPYPPGGYAAPYPPQEQPAAPYPTGGQAPPAPYPSNIGQPSAYPPTGGDPGDLSAYKDAPPAYADFSASPYPPQ